MSAGGIMKIFSNGGSTIIVEQNSLSMLLVSTHPSHIDCVVVMAEVTTVVRSVADGSFLFFPVSLRVAIDLLFGFGWRKPSPH